MVERLMILKDGDLNDEITKGTLSKGQSFNTEDDDDSAANDSPLQGEEDSVQQGEDDSVQQGEDDSPKASTNDIHLLSPEDHKRRLLLLLNSPSMDSVNDPEGSVSDIPLIEKIKKKKRRTVDRPNMSQLKKSIKKRPWYTRIDYEIFIKPLIAIGILILLYLAWVKRDVWIPRLLTSQTRLRHTIMKNEEKLGERGDTSITNKDSSSNSDEDDIMDDDDEKNNDQISNEDNDDDNTPLTHSKHSSQKINIRIRRNKMSFSKDKAKKTRGSKYRLSDDGDDDDDDDDDDDADVDVDEVDENNDDDDEDNVKENNETEQIVVKPIKGKENVIAPSKKRHNPRTTPSHEPKTQAKAKTTLILRSHDDIVDQLNKLVKSRGKKYDLSTLLIKQTGLTKAKINRFIHGKDFSIVTLDQINSVLNKFHSTLLIVSK